MRIESSTLESNLNIIRGAPHHRQGCSAACPLDHIIHNWLVDSYKFRMLNFLVDTGLLDTTVFLT